MNLCIPHSAFRIPHSAFCIPHSTFRIQHSAFCIPHSAFCILNSSLFPKQSTDDILHQWCAEDEIEQEQDENAEDDATDEFGALFLLALLVFSRAPTLAHLDAKLFLVAQFRIEASRSLFLFPCLHFRVIITRLIVEFLRFMSIKESHNNVCLCYKNTRY